ncbi:MAG: GbsR/MarR family transcriptional regulator [Spartobacteria bacterium]
MSAPLTAEIEKTGLSAWEVEAIEMFIHFLRLIGLPKSVGEIYGLLFVAPKPLAMDDIMERLDISLGAASQGLKLLRSFGAVRVVYERGDRRDHYVADLELSRFATAFIKDELHPRMDMAAERVRRMEAALSEMPPKERRATRERIARLNHWLNKGQKILPWLIRFMKF